MQRVLGLQREQKVGVQRHSWVRMRASRARTLAWGPTLASVSSSARVSGLKWCMRAGVFARDISHTVRAEGRSTVAWCTYLRAFLRLYFSCMSTRRVASSLVQHVL